ncbi:hypothetical protein BC628DRAFT_1500154 [Trametes gibbosa]|nr:hypothetical protein BC628DRAFT_1500154 [Trametes gibbosa]
MRKIADWKNFIPEGFDRQSPIPKPQSITYVMRPGWKHCMASQMRLASSRRDLRIYCKLVAKIAKRSEQHVKGVHRIDPRSHESWPRWLTFLKLITEELPILQAYQDAWPVAAIVKVHRHKSKSPRGLGLLQWDVQWISGMSRKDNEEISTSTDAPDEESDTTNENYDDASGADDQGDSGDSPNEQQPTSSKSKGEGDEPPSSASRPVPHKHCAAPSYPDISDPEDDIGPGSASASDPASPGAKTAAAPPGAANAASLHATQSPSSSPSPSPSATSSSSLGPVRAFLHALCPPQDALLGVLASKGVTDGTQLRGLARMAGRKAFLNALLREEAISELQFAALDAGLAALARGA